MPPTPLGTYLAYTFGTFCLLSAGPFLGLPANSRAANYYTGPDGKNAWIARLSGGRLTAQQAGYAGAALRVVLGAGLISARYRKVTCGVLAAVVGPGTYFAYKDGRPLLPQFGMLAAIGVVAVLG